MLSACTVDMVDNPVTPPADDQSAVDNGTWHVKAEYMDTTVQPGDDFFIYCNGGYWKTTEVGGDNMIQMLHLSRIGKELNEKVSALTLPSKQKVTADQQKTDAATISDERQSLLQAVQRVEALTTKQQARERTELLRNTFRQRISQNAWLSAASKQNAIAKLDAMVFNVGAPDEWIEEVLPDLSQQPNLAADIRALRRSLLALKCKIIGMSIQRGSFHQILIDSPLSTFNAFYYASGNFMNILPAFIMPPAYDGQQNEAHNFATMTVWGRQNTHVSVPSATTLQPVSRRHTRRTTTPCSASASTASCATLTAGTTSSVSNRTTSSTWLRKAASESGNYSIENGLLLMAHWQSQTAQAQNKEAVLDRNRLLINI